MTQELPLKNKLTVIVDWNETLEGNEALAELLADFQRNGAEIYIFSDTKDVEDLSKPLLEKAGLEAKYLHKKLKKDGTAWKKVPDAVEAPKENILVLDDSKRHIDYLERIAGLKGILWNMAENDKCLEQTKIFARSRGYNL
jgi:FMN phosphatase YigB (HAD superfamily)